MVNGRSIICHKLPYSVPTKNLVAQSEFPSQISMLSTIEIDLFEINAQTTLSRLPYLLTVYSVTAHCNHINSV